ncbi:hypothetical protein CDD81_2065 [Ophiocordyceps australis]|uniref:GH16 domain-containing protein n=1 Tax=Ophiocordyceps australis TaxID=1399860 RepID=A0A2C5XUM0_9HYPO|nr:hypothetical protein CDD81_2065 [Ophiocordyceps australis]
MVQMISLGLLVLSSVGSTAARQYRIENNRSYNASNFFDKFDFITAGDPNQGYVAHQSRPQAEEIGLAKTIGDEVYLGVEHESVLDPWWAARKSLRLESRERFNKGLLIARFTHLPKVQCGSWPAFWSLGEEQGRVWPNGGEIDIYEGWNNQVANQQVVHVGLRKDYGACTLDTASNRISSRVITSDCDNQAPNQPNFSGCQVRNGPGDIWGNPNGGTRKSFP